MPATAITTGSIVEHGKSALPWTVATIDGDHAVITRIVQTGPRNVYRQSKRVRLSSLRLEVPRWGFGGGDRWYCPCNPRNLVAGQGVPCGPTCEGA